MDSLNALYESYNTIKQSYDSLNSRCHTDEERSLLAEKYQTLFTQYQTALDLTFAADDATVTALQTELITHRQTLERLVQDEAQFATIATALTMLAETAVKLVGCGH